MLKAKQNLMSSSSSSVFCLFVFGKDGIFIYEIGIPNQILVYRNADVDDIDNIDDVEDIDDIDNVEDVEDIDDIDDVDDIDNI